MFFHSGRRGNHKPRLPQLLVRSWWHGDVIVTEGPPVEGSHMSTWWPGEGSGGQQSGGTKQGWLTVPISASGRRHKKQSYADEMQHISSAWIRKTEMSKASFLALDPHSLWVNLSYVWLFILKNGNNNRSCLTLVDSLNDRMRYLKNSEINIKFFKKPTKTKP